MSPYEHNLGASALEATVAVALLRSPTDTTASRIWKALAAADAELEPHSPSFARALADQLEIPTAMRAFRFARARSAARRALAAGRAANLSVITWRDPAYSPLLRHIADPPLVLWLRGDPGVFMRPAIGVVGSRDATPTGLMISRRLGRDLVDAGLVVVSGMARGIDAAAHAGALDAHDAYGADVSGAGGRFATIAVLGCGADVVYPASHDRLAVRVAHAGAVVSEFVPGMLPMPYHFPLRNRIISGLSLAVIVVEASEKSGSLITAKAALEQGRDVLAVPGSAISGQYRGCHSLIKEGARLVETVEDVLQEIGWGQRVPLPRPAVSDLRLSPLEATMAVGEPYSLDDLVERTSRAAAGLLAELGELELRGRVGRVPGGRFARLDRPVMNRTNTRTSSQVSEGD